MEKHDKEFEAAVERELGISPHWYNEGELQAMRQGFEHDRKIVDDDKAVFLGDKLKNDEPGDHDEAVHRAHHLCVKAPKSWCEKLNDERHLIDSHIGHTAA
jgi:hypothetical protein